ncbi:MAG: exo-alpha-sialidase [Lentisphaerae bacterium]|nr:exo-alpha-sialidase [Lentisphaerota bacterium]
MRIVNNRVISVLSDRLAQQIKDFDLRLAMRYAGYADPAVGYPPMEEDWGRFPQARVTRSKVYYGNEAHSYNHHHTLAKYGDHYLVSWSSGLAHEDHPGQQVRYAASTDGLQWGEDRVLAATDPDAGIVRNNVGMFAAGSALYALVGVCNTRGNRQLGMCSMEAERMRLDVYRTSNLATWEQCEGVAERAYIFEAPRPTSAGTMLCYGSAIDDWRQGLVLLWDNTTDPSRPPRVVEIPKADGLRPSQGTWYETEDGRLWMFLRDGAFSCRLALTFSDDGGASWSQPLFTDFPNTCSRAYAGRLADGRYYVAGNNYTRLLDRRTMLLALSADGTEYDRMFTVVTGDTSRRIEGKHKEDGYHYANCLADGDRLLLAYSYNKEDIDVAVIDTTSMA